MLKTLNPTATISRWACFKGTVETQQKYTPFKVCAAWGGPRRAGLSAAPDEPDTGPP